jgi:hypothetical protein
MKKTDHLPLIPICSDKELKEIAEQWCHIVGEEPTITTLNAFMMGAKIAISNKGWIRRKTEDNINDCGDANRLSRQLGIDPDPILKEMQSGDYENLLEVFDREFGSFVTLYR